MTDEQLIEALGFSSASDEVKMRVVTAARETVERRVMMLVEAMMSRKQAKEFQKLTKTGDSQSGWEYLEREVVPGGFDELYGAAFKDYIAEFGIRK